jgi:hypothetical protein
MIDVWNFPAGRELDALVANKVMGYQILGYASIWTDSVRVIRNGLGVTFHPSEDTSAAFDTQAELHRRGYHMQLKSPFLPDSDAAESGHVWFCGFTPHGTSGWNGRPDFLASGETPALAICRAALLVAETWNGD